MRSGTKRDGGAIGIALAAMLAAAACGGRVDGEPRPAERQSTTPDEPTVTHPPSMTVTPPPTTTVLPPPPPPSFDRATCGDGGGRMSASDFCGSATRQAPCDLPEDAGTGTFASLDNATCRRLCLSSPSDCERPEVENRGVCGRLSCNVRKVAEGTELYCYDACPGGRRPAGYGGERSMASTSLGRAFARLAQLESVSIPAFGRLADELTRLGLSPALSLRAKKAQQDEVRHARDTWRLARRFGASTTRLGKMPRARERSLLELALENVEEGCVREAYGSVVAAHQAESAADPEVRRIMSGIARDEAQHAELAWAIHDELMTKLSSSERALVAGAFDEAWAALARDVAAAETDELLRSSAGLPERDAARAGLRALQHAVRERLAVAA